MQLGLIGKKLSHSWSKAYIEKKYTRLIPGLTYDLKEISEISELNSFIKETPWVGFNVTIPYKEKIIPFLHDLTPTARATGAVNCVKRTPQGWIGHNTDVEGFLKSLRPFYETSWKKALILGSGGSARAVSVALKELNINHAVIVRHNAPAGFFEIFLTYNDLLPEIIRNVQLIINTTPAGMFPDTENMPPFPIDEIGPGHFVYDLIYNPSETLFLKKCREKGAQTINGLNMLYFQADASVKFWLEADS